MKDGDTGTTNGTREGDTEERRRLRGFGRAYERGAVVWIEYWHRGKQHRESTGQKGHAGERAAERLLKKRWQEIGRGRFIGPSEERVLLTDLLDTVVTDYKVNGRRSGWTLSYRLTPLRAAFAGERAIDVNEDRIAKYTEARLGEGYAPASVNRELAALRRAFRLAVRQKRLATAPTITLLAENNARQGFVDPAAFAQIVKHLSAPLADVAAFAYRSGWRKSEVLTLAWSDVDRSHGLINLRRENSKNAEPRILPLTPALTEIIERRWQSRTITRPNGDTVLADLVFHRAGQPISSFRKAWARACITAGLSRPKTDKQGRPVLTRSGQPVVEAALLFHDLRRSAVRNMERAGVSQAVAMKITGHKTASVYRRYRIVDERDLRDALAKTEAAAAADHAVTVVPISRRAREARA
jgi:integrase